MRRTSLGPEPSLSCVQYVSGQGTWNASIPFPARPMYRDTVTIPPGGYLHLRFIVRFYFYRQFPQHHP